MLGKRGRKAVAKKVDQPFMNGVEFIKIAGRLGFESMIELSDFLQIGKRTGFRYQADLATIPGPTADLLRLLAKGKVTRKDVELSRK